MADLTDCVTHAFNAYLRRASNDTNPTIVQLLGLDGKRDCHWYYRYNQVVSTSAFDWPENFPSYEGRVEELPDVIRKHFSHDKFVVYDFLMRCAQRSLEAGCKTYEEACAIGFNFGKK